MVFNVWERMDEYPHGSLGLSLAWLQWCVLAQKFMPIYNIIAWICPLTIALPLLVTKNLECRPLRYHPTAVSIVSLVVAGPLWVFVTFAIIMIFFIIIWLQLARAPGLRRAVSTSGYRSQFLHSSVSRFYISFSLYCRLSGKLFFFFYSSSFSSGYGELFRPLSPFWLQVTAMEAVFHGILTLGIWCWKY